MKQDKNNLHFIGGKIDIKNNLSKIAELVTGRVNHITFLDKWYGRKKGGREGMHFNFYLRSRHSTAKMQMLLFGGSLKTFPTIVPEMPTFTFMSLD